MLVDSEQVLVSAGGDLEHYGLSGVQQARPAGDQLPFLEGLLPLPETPFLLRSMEMASGRVADIHFFAEGEATWIVLLDVTHEHGETRKTQQKAYDMTLLSQREARLRAKLQAAHAELTQAHRALAESREALLLTHNRLQRELRDAERYVRAILPAPLKEPFLIDWLFVPCTELGGDSFGYHWIDAEHFSSARLVSAFSAQYPHDVSTLDCVERRVWSDALGEQGLGFALANLVGKRSGMNRVVARENDRPLDGVLELADISRPGIFLKLLCRFSGELLGLLAALPRDFRKE